jgi:2,4-diketo-3-deoxy-L-fuconate hydrolase
MTNTAPSTTNSFTRRHRKGLTLTGSIVAGVLLASVASYGVIRAIPAEFPLVYSETVGAGVTEGVSIAAPDTALTFARIDTGAGPTVLAVTGYQNGQITGVDLNAAAGTSFTEPIEAFNSLGYAAIQSVATDQALRPVTVASANVLTSLDTHSHHIGTGTNYIEHQAESDIEEPFLFPKIAAPTDSHGTLPVGDGLLDYEVELGVVPLTDITATTGIPEHMGLVLSNDWTDRELLTQQIEPDDLTNGAGFTNAKSQPGFLSTGDLFVIPADWQSYYQELELDLWVDGDLRQRAHPTDMVWDAATMIEKSLAMGDKTWDSDGQQEALTQTPGTITAGTIIQSGTPEGVVYRAPDTRQKFLGFMEYAGSFGTNADSIVDSALQVYVRDAHDAGVFLKSGDEIVTRADGLGQIFTTIVDGDRAETE